ncbi:MAG: helix-turn-helix domain-containing protein [Planctomycetota bacterium]|jgi:excisionase family DNA binding protein
MTPDELERIAEAVAERVAAKMTGMDPDPMGDRHQAAKWLGVSVATVERLTRSGAIPSVKLGRLRRYRRSDLTGNRKGGAA